MIDLKQQREWAQKWADKGYVKIGVCPKAIVELLDMLEAAKLDAERYQWLRHGGIGNLPHSNFGDGPVYDEIDALDHYIDAAMAATKGEQA